MSACAQVLAIPELLEAILIHLPPKDLLLAQRVHTTFRDTVQTSSVLQQAMFFRTEPAPANYDRTQSWLDINPFLFGPRARPNYWFTSLALPIGDSNDFAPGYSGRDARFDLNKPEWSKIQDLLRASPTTASWLDMYPQSTAVPVTLGGRLGHSGNHPQDLDVGWYVRVRASTMRELLRLSLALREAAMRYRKAVYEAHSETLAAGRVVVGVGDVGWDWKESWTAEQLSWIIGQPTFVMDSVRG